jgi:hypothetical protein
MLTWTVPSATWASVSRSIKGRFGLDLQIHFSADLGCDLMGEESTKGRFHDSFVQCTCPLCHSDSDIVLEWGTGQ